MLVQEFKVKGFRSLRDSDVRGLRSKVIFHGDNGSGKSNLCQFLEYLFASKYEAVETVLPDDVTELPPEDRRTPFWYGVIPDFDSNFYLGKVDEISFDVVLQVKPSYFDEYDLAELVEPFIRPGHSLTFRLQGKIVRDNEKGRMELRSVDLENKTFFKRTAKTVQWLPDSELQDETKQNFVEDVLSSFTDQVKVVPASRYLSEEAFSQDRLSLRPSQFKRWLHSLSLSREDYNTYKKICQWFESRPLRLGEVSFMRAGDNLELMVDDGCGYRMSVEQKGSGVQQILVLLGYVAATDAAVVAIEEPELNLSFANQDMMVTILRDLVEQENTRPYQILLTSHSDHIGSREDLKRYHVEKPRTSTEVRQFITEDRARLFPRSPGRRRLR